MWKTSLYIGQWACQFERDILTLREALRRGITAWISMKVIFPRSDIARIVCHHIRTHFAKLSIDQKRFLSVPTEASRQVITSTVRWGLLIAYSKSQITHEYPWKIFCWEAETLSLSFNLFFYHLLYIGSYTYMVGKCNNIAYLSLLKHLII